MSIVCLLALAFAAQQQPNKPGAPAHMDPRPVLVAFGNSLTAGFGVEPGLSYPDDLEKEIEKHGLHWRVVNAGVSGDTTTDGLNRVPEVLTYKPAIVILEFGGNDGLRGLPLDTTRANLDQMIAQLQKGGAKVVLAGMTLPPNYGPEYIRPFEKIYVDLAAKYKIPRIRFLLEGVGGNPALMQRDGLHATAEGNRIVARNVYKTVEPLLKNYLRAGIVYK
jgi:acyl-CoA thioesterase-1